MIKGRVKVRVMRAGLSLNRNFYPDAVLRESLTLFDGTRVFVKSDREHLGSGGKDVRNLIGRIVSPEFVPGAGRDTGEIYGVLELIDPDSETGRKIILVIEKNMGELLGLSIDAEGAAEDRMIEGRPARYATQISKVKSVDLIVEPGAGGQVINLIEAAGPSEGYKMDLSEIIALIKAKRPDLLKDVNLEEISESNILRLLGQALSASGGDGVAMAEAVNLVRTSRLPAAAKRRLIEGFAGTEPSRQSVIKAISSEIAYLQEANPSGPYVTGVGSISFVEGGSQEEKHGKMLDSFFNPKDRSVISIRECYRTLTGDNGFTGRIQKNVRLSEALDSTSFANVLGNSITRQMVEAYNAPDVFTVWKDLAKVNPVTDFRIQERTRFGGYGDLPAVAEAAAYQALNSPDDEKATYAISKRGGLETVTLEMIANDDVAVIADIPRRLAQAAKRTLSKFVLNTFVTNAAIYDGVPLFHATHANLGSAALSSAAVGAGRLAIKSQTERDSNEKIGVGPAYLLVPDALEETAYNLFKRDTNLDANFIQSLQLQVLPVWCWTDANDWMLATRPNEVPVMEVGFFNGNEEPEIFIQDAPTHGSHFTNDKITYKIRHIYGGTVVDYRGVYKSVVANA